MRTWLLLSLLGSIVLLYSPNGAFVSVTNATSEASDKAEIEMFLNQAFQERTEHLIHGSPNRLSQYYIETERSSMAALRQEKNRYRYLHSWSGKRNLQFVDGQSEIRIVRTKLQGNVAKISLVQKQRLDYVYLNEILLPQSFGLGTRHFLTLKKTKFGWHILNEWYLDPLEENPELIADSINDFPSSIKERAIKEKIASYQGNVKYRREMAVEYANKYAGLAWGAGSNNRYNPKYKDYTGLGGDCTNFASQAIGDPEEGGGLPMTKQWRTVSARGSEAWIRTDSFKDFLLYSGYAQLISKGTFQDIVKLTNEHPFGAIGELEPGDLIAYELKGDVDHFSIIVGFDDNGYPLVNSHTTDRYRVPFDLGWDKSTKYWLIHVRDTF